MSSGLLLPNIAVAYRSLPSTAGGKAKLRIHAVMSSVYSERKSAAFAFGLVPVQLPSCQATLHGISSRGKFATRSRRRCIARISMASGEGSSTPDQTIGNVESTKTAEDVDEEQAKKQKEIERLRAAEKFIQIDEGTFECSGCGYIYEPKKGEFLNGISAGTSFDKLPDDFCCPACKTPKARFYAKKKTIAGFADNQRYGFGSNSLTAGQKNSLIFGGLLLCFLLLLSGYALN